ncbi:MAG: hypothetical protein RL015_2978 [Verrucomicrobiota bacterium]|jgi:two-component system cell cycle sensor histidine kinase/response regulator CckA
MNALRNRILLPLMLLGWLSAIGAARFMEQPLDWIFISQSFILRAGVFVAAYMDQWLGS